MATQKQIRANRRNARRSTGPRTPQGKAKASRNSWKHGIFARSTLIPGEKAKDFETFVRNLADELAPATELEAALVRQLADAEWRLRRATRLEAGLVRERWERARQSRDLFRDTDDASDDPLHARLLGTVLIHDAQNADSLSKLSRHEMRLPHRYFKALRYLREAQTLRLARQASSRPQNENDQRTQFPLRRRPPKGLPCTTMDRPRSDPGDALLPKTNPIAPRNPQKWDQHK